MSKTTEFLKLFKYDPAEDGILRFNINRALNDNWDKIDAAFAAQPGIPITIPGGWMRGDPNHDGIVDMLDHALYGDLFNGTLVLEGMALEAADANNDGNANMNDRAMILNIINGIKVPEDLMENWTADENEKQYSADITVNGLTAGAAVDIYLPDDAGVKNCRFLKGECFDGFLRITCKHPPVAAVTAYVREGQTSGVRFITDKVVLSTENTKPCAVVVGSALYGHTLPDCDFLCTGTNDDAVINAAILAANSGGEVLLLAGTYNIGEEGILLDANNVTLRGEGPATILSASTTTDNVIQFSAQRKSCAVRDLTIEGQGEDYNRLGIEIRGRQGYRSTVQDVIISGFEVAIEIAAGKTYGKAFINGCTIQDCMVGLLVTSGADCIISGNRIDMTGSYVPEGYDGELSAMTLSANTQNNLVTGNLIVKGQITDGGTGNTVTNNKVEEATA